MIIKKGSKVLFQGDSITDCGRDRETEGKLPLGRGYANIAASLFNSLYPELDVEFINKGIAGNRTCDLCQRWTQDCIELKPDVLSILIGINDTWHGYSKGLYTTAEQYYNNYKEILTRTKLEVGDIPIIMLEPFVLPYPEDRITWREDLDPKIQKARQLAREFEATYIPLDGIFAQNSITIDPSYWAADGVHPTSAGHGLIARYWLEAIGY